MKLKKLNNEVIRYLNQFDPAPTNLDWLKGAKSEESRLRAVICMRFSEREAGLDPTLFTGMRRAERYEALWRHVDLEYTHHATSHLDEALEKLAGFPTGHDSAVFDAPRAAREAIN